MADDLYDALLRKLLRSRDRDENYQTAKAALWVEVESDPDKYLKMFFSNWFNNNWSRKPVDERKPAPVKPYTPRPVETPEAAKERRQRDANLRGLALMNSFLSNGETRLKDATGAQLRKELGWFKLLVKWVKPHEVLGRKLTAEQLANLREQAS